MNEMKNVHSYDRQLKNQYNPTKNYTNDDKKKLYTDFKDEITDPYAKDMITTMLSDALKGDKMDDMNEIDWSDLFSDILSHKGLVDMKQILEVVQYFSYSKTIIFHPLIIHKFAKIISIYSPTLFEFASP